MKEDCMIRLKMPELFDFGECRWFLDRNFDDRLHRIEGDTIVKAVRTDEGVFLLRLSASGHQLEIRILSGKTTAAAKRAVRAYVTDWLDMDRDIAPFYRLLERDARLAYMTTAFRGLRLVGIPDLFEALCWSIIGQQINLTFAYRLKNRLTELFGTPVTCEAHTCWLFPTPEALAGADLRLLRELQFSERKAQFLTGIAQAFRDGALGRAQLDALADPAQKVQLLTSFRGIGRWTANYVLMKSLKEPSGIPHGDAGLLQALLRHGIIRERSDTAAAGRLFGAFSGWESYLVLYLWRSLSER